MDTLIDLRLQRGAEHLHRLGPRAIAGYLGDLSRRIGGLPAALGLLAEYETKLTPDMLRATGGDRFPQRLRVVPKEAGR